MEIRLAKVEELELLKKRYSEVVDFLHARKEVSIWYDGYPMNMLEGDIEKDWLYVLVDDNELVGAVALTSEFTHEQHFNWKVEGAGIYVNRLGVFMPFQGKGYAKKFMNLIKEFAIENGYKAVRLMVNHHNAPAIATYEKSGFIWTGDAYVPPLFPKETILGYELPL